ncbi:MAG TPA: hypothetical protein VHQ44_08530, partial [Thermoanaerobaculia bacterium]|nr:hypothetical protein [Thermoanaerobaculia bacterium]
MSSLPVLLRVIDQEALMNVNTLRRCRMGVLLLAATVGSAAAARADDGHSGQPHFTARDIKGSYGFTCSGTAFGAPFAQLGQVSCDGRDTCAGTGVVNVNGVRAFSSLVGTYTVKSNGLGFITY